MNGEVVDDGWLDVGFRFVDDGLARVTGNTIEVTAMGRLVIRNIAMCFDRYLDDMASDKSVFSRTV